MLNKKITSIILFIFITTLVFSTAMLADELSEAKDVRLKIFSDIDNIEEEVKTKEAELEKKFSQNEIIEETVKVESSNLQDLNDSYGKYKEIFDLIENQAIKAREEYENISKDAKEAIVRLYKNSNNFYIASFLESDNFLTLFNKIAYMDKIVDKDLNIISLAQTKLQESDYKKSIALSNLEEGYEDLRDQQTLLTRAISSRSDSERDIRMTMAEIDKLEQAEDELIEYSYEIVDEIKELQKNTDSYVGGDMLWPLPGYFNISSYYGMRLHPIYNVWKMHTGLDIGANYYENIVSANDGIVIFAGYRGGYGYTVIVDHGGGITTLYAHCSKLYVEYDDLVFKGDVIAAIGSTGASTGPHLHFEVREDASHTNPLEYVSN